LENRVKPVRRLIVGAVLLALSLPAAASGQIVARQAEAATPQRQTFTSPMELEIPLPWLDELAPNQIRHVEGVRDFVCDGVFVQSMSVRRGYGSKNAVFDLTVVLGVEPGHDKYVNMGLELLLAEAPAVRLRAIAGQVEERKIRVFNVPIKVESARLAAASPILRLRLSARND
jgi:hypothetical protein